MTWRMSSALSIQSPKVDSAWGLPAALGLADETERLRDFLETWVEQLDPEVLPMVRYQLEGRAKYFRPVTLFACHRAVTQRSVPLKVLRSARGPTLFSYMSTTASISAGSTRPFSVKSDSRRSL